MVRVFPLVISRLSDIFFSTCLRSESSEEESTGEREEENVAHNEVMSSSTKTTVLNTETGESQRKQVFGLFFFLSES